MPYRLKLLVAYDGAPFSGWQSQPGGNTIQDHLEKAFARVAGEPVRLHGAGRTDAGVHALAQTAHADLPSRSLGAARWPAALNASLPPAIRVLRCRYMAQGFHARFSAKGKVYRYRVWNAAVVPPFEVSRAWHVPGHLDFEVISGAAQAFCGRHDFASYAANRGKPGESTVRTIQAVRIRRHGPLLTLEFFGDGFLYKMVRLMVGTLVRCGLGRMSPEEISARLHSGAQTGRAAGFAAPADGLFLVRVRY